MQKFHKYTDVFSYFFSFYKLVSQVKIHVVYKKKYRRFYFCYYFSVVVKDMRSIFGLFTGVCIVSLCEVAYLRVIIIMYTSHR